MSKGDRRAGQAKRSYVLYTINTEAASICWDSLADSQAAAWKLCASEGMIGIAKYKNYILYHFDQVFSHGHLWTESKSKFVMHHIHMVLNSFKLIISYRFIQSLCTWREKSDIKLRGWLICNPVKLVHIMNLLWCSEISLRWTEPNFCCIMHHSTSSWINSQSK